MFQDKCVVVGIPSYDARIDYRITGSLMEAATNIVAGKGRIGLMVCPGLSLVQKARDKIFTKFLRVEGATHLFFIDSDVAYETQDFLQIVARCASDQVLCGMVPSRGEPPTFTMRPLFRDGQPVREGDLVEFERIGTAFMCIGRAVAERLIELYPEQYDEGDEKVYGMFPCGYNPDTQEFRGEDYGFCDRVRSAGFRIFGVPNMTFRHRTVTDCIGNFQTDIIDEGKLVCISSP